MHLTIKKEVFQCKSAQVLMLHFMLPMTAELNSLMLSYLCSFCFLLLFFLFCHCTAFFWSNIKNSIHLYACVWMHFSCSLQCMKNGWKAFQKYVVTWLYQIDLLQTVGQYHSSSVLFKTYFKFNNCWVRI